jgi:hypothetical protein
MAGSVPLILVDPGHQRRGIGTGLLEAAVRQICAGAASSVTAGSGGGVYIWPGVPRDLPAAVGFFASRGWRHTHNTLDLVTDLADYRPPPGVAGPGVTITLATSDDLTAVRAFEAATFPSWARWYDAAHPEEVLLARARSGAIAGALLLEGPGADTVFAPMLGQPPGPLAASALSRHCTGRGSGRPWSCAPPRSSARQVSAPATSAGPTASRSTAAPDTSPGGVMPCTPARPDQSSPPRPEVRGHRPSQPSAMIAERDLAAHSPSAVRRRNRLTCIGR